MSLESRLRRSCLVRRVSLARLISLSYFLLEKSYSGEHAYSDLLDRALPITFLFVMR